MADSGDRQAGRKKFADEFLQNFALQIFAHAPRAMPARQQQVVEISATHVSPGERRLERCILLRACRRVRPHQAADGGEAPQARYEAPEVQALAGQVVRPPHPPVGRGEYDGMAEPLQHPPTPLSDRNPCSGWE